MFATILEMTVKQGKGRDLCAAIDREGFAIAEKFPGFLVGFCLVREEAPDSVVEMSFWQNRDSAEKFRTEGYPQILGLYRPFLYGGVQVRGCEVPGGLRYKGKSGSIPPTQTRKKADPAE